MVHTKGKLAPGFAVAEVLDGLATPRFELRQSQERKCRKIGFQLFGVAAETDQVYSIT